MNGRKSKKATRKIVGEIQTCELSPYELGYGVNRRYRQGFQPKENRTALQKFRAIRSGGGDRNRTGVQTWHPKAFYMLIPAFIVGKGQEPDAPTISLAV
jgi:hypothetical protein